MALLIQIPNAEHFLVTLVLEEDVDARIIYEQIVSLYHNPAASV